MMVKALLLFIVSVSSSSTYSSYGQASGISPVENYMVKNSYYKPMNGLYEHVVMVAPELEFRVPKWDYYYPTWLHLYKHVETNTWMKITPLNPGNSHQYEWYILTKDCNSSETEIKGTTDSLHVISVNRDPNSIIIIDTRVKNVMHELQKLQQERPILFFQQSDIQQADKIFSVTELVHNKVYPAITLLAITILVLVLVICCQFMRNRESQSQQRQQIQSMQNSMGLTINPNILKF
eukprot:288155_1